MAIVYQSQDNSTAASSTTIAINKPSGTVDGDLLITAISFASSGGSGLLTTLSGWTLINSTPSYAGGTVIYISVFYKIASSEGSSYTWTFSSGTDSAGCVIRVNGQAASSYIGANDVAGTSSGTTSLSLGSGITPTVSDCLLLQCWGTRNFSSNTAVSAYAIATSNPSWTEACDIYAVNGGTVTGLAIAYANRPETTLTGANTATASPSTNAHCCFILELRRETSFTSTITDTTTVTDAITPSIGYTAIITDTVTATDSTIADKARAYSNTAKSSNTWANTQKS